MLDTSNWPGIVVPQNTDCAVVGTNPSLQTYFTSVPYVIGMAGANPTIVEFALFTEGTVVHSVKYK